MKRITIFLILVCLFLTGCSFNDGQGTMSNKSSRGISENTTITNNTTDYTVTITDSENSATTQGPERLDTETNSTSVSTSQQDTIASTTSETNQNSETTPATTDVATDSQTTTEIHTVTETTTKTNTSTETSTLNCTHNYNMSVVDAQCEKDGQITYICTKCGYSYSIKIAASGHRYQINSVIPSCTTAGYIEHTCLNCGKTYRDNEKPALGHIWQAATCTKAQTCYRCKETKGDPLAHQFGEWSVYKEPTINAVGIERRICSACRTVESRDIPKLVARKLNITFKNIEGDIIPDGTIRYTTYCSAYSTYKTDSNGYPISYYADGMKVDITVSQTEDYKAAAERIVIEGDMNIDIILSPRYMYYKVNPSINAVKCGLIYIKQGNKYTKLNVKTGGTNSAGAWLYTYSANGTYLSDQYAHGLGPIDTCNLPSLYTRIENNFSESSDNDYTIVRPSINAAQNGLIYYKINNSYAKLNVSTGGTTTSGQWVFTYSINGMYLGDQCAEGLHPGDTCNLSPLYTKQ